MAWLPLLCKAHAACSTTLASPTILLQHPLCLEILPNYLAIQLFVKSFQVTHLHSVQKDYSITKVFFQKIFSGLAWWYMPLILEH